MNIAAVSGRPRGDVHTELRDKVMAHLLVSATFLTLTLVAARSIMHDLARPLSAR